MDPRTFSNMISSMLYERRFGPWFCEPVIGTRGGGEQAVPVCHGPDWGTGRDGRFCGGRNVHGI